MGLLDDAIREHLELKRRRGADPGEVAREQHEALDPVERSASSSAAQGALDAPAPAAVVEEPFEAPHGGVVEGGVVEAVPAERTDVAQEQQPGGGDETAELDMRTVLGDDATPGVAGGVRPAAGDSATPHDPPGDDEDSLEWETPGAQAAPPVDDERGEDVLEETPDFLRETPEQERMWFEQRPPRDFDFDK
jgi:hypothetical protein